jgi:hypothetical protein
MFNGPFFSKFSLLSADEFAKQQLLVLADGEERVIAVKSIDCLARKGGLEQQTANLEAAKKIAKDCRYFRQGVGSSGHIYASHTRDEDALVLVFRINTKEPLSGPFDESSPIFERCQKDSVTTLTQMSMPDSEVRSFFAVNAVGDRNLGPNGYWAGTTVQASNMFTSYVYDRDTAFSPKIEEVIGANCVAFAEFVGAVSVTSEVQLRCIQLLASNANEPSESEESVWGERGTAVRQVYSRLSAHHLQMSLNRVRSIGTDAVVEVPGDKGSTGKWELFRALVLELAQQEQRWELLRESWVSDYRRYLQEEEAARKAARVAKRIEGKRAAKKAAGLGRFATGSKMTEESKGGGNTNERTTRGTRRANETRGLSVAVGALRQEGEGRAGERVRAAAMDKHGRSQLVNLVRQGDWVRADEELSRLMLIGGEDAESVQQFVAGVVNARDKHGHTLLMFACMDPAPAAVAFARRLLRRGEGDALRTNHQVSARAKLTAAQYAEKAGHLVLAEELGEHTKRRKEKRSDMVCPTCGEWMKYKPNIRYIAEEVQRELAAEVEAESSEKKSRKQRVNPLLAQFFATGCLEELCGFKYHRLANLGNIKKEITETMAMVNELSQILQASWAPTAGGTAGGTESVSGHGDKERGIGWYRQQLVELYQKHNPPKVHDVDRILEKFSGREQEVLEVARHKYAGFPIAASSDRHDRTPIHQESFAGAEVVVRHHRSTTEPHIKHMAEAQEFDDDDEDEDEDEDEDSGADGTVIRQISARKHDWQHDHDWHHDNDDGDGSKIAGAALESAQRRSSIERAAESAVVLGDRTTEEHGTATTIAPKWAQLMGVGATDAHAIETGYRVGIGMADVSLGMADAYTQEVFCPRCQKGLSVVDEAVCRYCPHCQSLVVIATLPPPVSAPHPRAKADPVRGVLPPAMPPPTIRVPPAPSSVEESPSCNSSPRTPLALRKMAAGASFDDDETDDDTDDEPNSEDESRGGVRQQGGATWVHVLDLCSGKSLTTAFITSKHYTERFPRLHVTAIDRMPFEQLPHYDLSSGNGASSPGGRWKDGGRQLQYRRLDVLAPDFFSKLQQHLTDVDRLTGAPLATKCPPARVVMLAMHLCGQLSVRAIQVFLRTPAISDIILCPCCLPSQTDPTSPKALYKSRQAADQYLAWVNHLLTILQGHPLDGHGGGMQVQVESARNPDILSPQCFIIRASKKTLT